MTISSIISDLRYGLEQHVKTSVNQHITQLIFYDHVPRKVSFPYATWGEHQLRILTSDQPKTFEIIQNLSIWTHLKETTLCQSIGYALISLCDDAVVTITSVSLSSIRVLSTDMRRDSNGVYARFTLRLRIVVDVIS
jgi:Protein of unknown function (DUF3168)